MKGLFDDPDKHVVHWPNTALNESKTRKIEGRAKQPDFTVSIVYQLQTSDTIFVGEDKLDSSIDKGADIKVLGFQCVGIYTMINVGQVLIPASLKDMSSFIDSMELSLGIQDIFCESYKNLYARLCNPGSLIKKASFKQDTLSTPKFRKLVSKTQ
ncbi:11949_t:CDS:2, partial [Funneliformis geosporum]